ncbi:MAG TPA: AbrB/MazE/SpoVT family DNA-binding domain-containing protein [Arthrobacter sp.]|nr:AbrB/MazE/SpoVT family DNA-binding domain-containing protein [Arthrobacter sp.]
MKDPNRRFYGAITVSERGQIVIPAQARRDFGIGVGEKLLVFGDLRYGLAIDKAENILARDARVEQILGGSADHD